MDKRRGFNSLVILTALCLWKHRNDCVFNDVLSCALTVLRMISDKAHLRCMAGGKGLRALLS
ncbi:hypothetical protein PR202_ga23852 [Eleusine coracana subsp. coracana]|uniref:Uncharacterized protein n=1 Tax=Eleusine coracana subsp. coracana TaxID=191504 RepID=A0AAV5D6B1_ELECO|nr:hypothetical protein PR202_ga23852 [Eleusine coracana subsp. coracana]